MKKILYIFILTVSFSSCSDYLDEINRNSINGEALYATPEGFENLINSCYSYSRVWFGKADGYAFTEMGTDCYTGGGSSAGRAPQMAFYTQDLQGTMELMEYMWNALYSGLNACNAAIGRVSESGLSDELQNYREGEARFLRALYLHLIAETWGNAILYTNEINSPVTTAERSSIDDFYTQIQKDLDIAIEKLAGTPSKNEGRVTQNAAKALKARMCLFDKQYAEAGRLAKEVIASPEYSMYDSFAETFEMDNNRGEDNSEAIWWVNYCADEALQPHFDMNDNDIQRSPLMGERIGSQAPIFSAMAYWMVGGSGVWVSPDMHAPWVQCLPTIDFLNMFDETTDQRYDATFRTTWFVNSLTDNYTQEYGMEFGSDTSGLAIGDTAFVTLKQVVTDDYRASKMYKIFDRNDVYDEEGKTVGTRDYFVSTYKFEDNTRATGWEYDSERDFFVLRIAEMYLIVAEAELMNNNLSEAVDYMNILREKRAIDGKETEMRISEADMDIDFILDERARELAGEQLRFFDLKRTGKFMERINQHNPDAAENIQEFHQLRPIPQAELDAITNKDNFTQNPGYN